MSDRDDEVAALKARLAALEGDRDSGKGQPRPQATSLLGLVGRGALLLVAVCCGLLIIGAAQSEVPESEVAFNATLAVVVAFIGIVCGWLALRKPPSR